MTAPFLIVSHSTTMMDDNRVKNCGAQDLLPTSGPAILIESCMNVLPSPVFLAGVRLGENDHTRCVAMQEVAPSDRTDLALGKESRRWDGAEPLLHDPAIVMGLAEESLSAPATAEQEGSEWRILVLRSIRSQENVQVVACRLRIAKVELHGLAFLDDVSDRDGSGLLVRSDEVPNEEVAPLEMTPVLIDHDA
jgi:hypothetical protein